MWYYISCEAVGRLELITLGSEKVKSSTSAGKSRRWLWAAYTRPLFHTPELEFPVSEFLSVRAETTGENNPATVMRALHKLNAMTYGAIHQCHKTTDIPTKKRSADQSPASVATKIYPSVITDIFTRWHLGEMTWSSAVEHRVPSALPMRPLWGWKTYWGASYLNTKPGHALNAVRIESNWHPFCKGEPKTL